MHPPIKPLSVILADTLRGDATVTLGEITDRVSRRGFGLFVIVLALPTLIPVLPPGTAAMVGLLYVLLSLQMLWGLDQPWLPRRVRAYRLSARAVAALRDRGVPFLQRLERFSRPRPVVWDDRIATRVIAVVILVLGVVLFSPLPFLNTLPALAALMLGAGLLNRDGVFVLAGLLMATVVIVVIVFGAGTLYALVTWLRDR